MKYQSTKIEGSYIINLEKINDDRGFFSRLFCANEFLEKNLTNKWAQINNSFSKNIGTLRGLHLQSKPHSEIKLIRCIRGAIWDVIVDLRKDSSSYGKWVGAELNNENRSMFYIPKGCAHGFITLKEDSEIIYFNSEYYAPNSERILRWNDPTVNINWPIEPKIISDKDSKGSLFEEFDY